LRQVGGILRTAGPSLGLKQGVLARPRTRASTGGEAEPPRSYPPQHPPSIRDATEFTPVFTRFPCDQLHPSASSPRRPTRHTQQPPLRLDSCLPARRQTRGQTLPGVGSREIEPEWLYANAEPDAAVLVITQAARSPAARPAPHAARLVSAAPPAPPSPPPPAPSPSSSPLPHPPPSPPAASLRRTPTSAPSASTSVVAARPPPPRLRLDAGALLGKLPRYAPPPSTPTAAPAGRLFDDDDDDSLPAARRASSVRLSSSPHCRAIPPADPNLGSLGSAGVLTRPAGCPEARPGRAFGTPSAVERQLHSPTHSLAHSVVAAACSASAAAHPAPHRRVPVAVHGQRRQRQRQRRGGGARASLRVHLARLRHTAAAALRLSRTGTGGTGTLPTRLIPYLHVPM
jgi:hypothetical protein